MTDPRFLLRATRPMFLPASVMPVLAGAAFAHWQTGAWNAPNLLLCAIGIALLHAASNAINDYCDHASGNDAINEQFITPFTGGSRVVQQGLLSPCQMRNLAVALFAAGGTVGLWLAWRTGWPVLAFGAAGIAGGVAYSNARLRLAARGLGELLVGLLFGVLPVVGSYYVQTSRLSWAPVCLSLPLAVLIVAVLFVNQFPDFAADRAVGKRNWVVRLGRRRAARLHVGIALLWGLAICAMLGSRLGSPALALCALPGLGFFFTVPWTLRNCNNPRRLRPANAVTIAMSSLTGLLMTAVLLAPPHRPAKQSDNCGNAMPRAATEQR